MRTISVTLSLILWCVPLYAVNLDIIKQIESGGRNHVISKRGAYGAYQIRACVLREYNQESRSNLGVSSLKKERVGRRIADWYLHRRIPQLLRRRGLPVTLENQLIAYNAGHTRVGKRLPKETKDYIRRYYEVLKEKGINLK